MQRGRKPLPTELKVLRGDRRDRINQDAPPAVPSAPECPDTLDADARAEWPRIVQELSENGVLSHTDRSAIALYCDAYSLWVRAGKVIVEKGLLLETANGSLKVNPAVSIARSAVLQMNRLLVEFGLTPSARARVSTTSKTEAPKDALTTFIRKGRG